MFEDDEDEERRLTTKRAKADPVIGPFITAAKTELDYHAKFRIEALIKTLNLQFYRSVLYDHMPRIVRIIAKDLNCKLVPYAGQNEKGEHRLAGINTGKATGYCKAGKEYAALADAANSRRVALTGGIAREHNEIASVIEGATGEVRNRLNAEVSRLKAPGTLRIAKSFIEALKGGDK